MTTPVQPEWKAEDNRKRGLIAAALTVGTITLGGTAAFLVLMERHEQRQDAPVAELAAPDTDAEAVLAELQPEESVAVQDAMSTAAAAQEKVATLEAELGEAKARIAAFEEAEAKGAERSASARKRGQEMEAEFSRLRVALADAEAERDNLRTELASSLKLLDEQIAQTARVRQERDVWKQASTDNLWAAFVENTKVKLCDRGSRKSMSKCHEAIAVHMDAEARQRFDHCVAARQSVPALVEIDRRSTPPAFSERLPEGVRQIGKDWHLVYCDPNLPEAVAQGENELPQPTVMSLARK